MRPHFLQAPRFVDCVAALFKGAPEGPSTQAEAGNTPRGSGVSNIVARPTDTIFPDGTFVRLDFPVRDARVLTDFVWKQEIYDHAMASRASYEDRHTTRDAQRRRDPWPWYDRHDS